MGFKRRVTNVYENDAAPEVEFELNYEPQGHVDTLFAKLAETHIIGYLVHDGDCQSPFEWNGTKIVTSSRRNSSNDDHRAMQLALGLGRDWEPDLGLVEEDPIIREEYITHFIEMQDAASCMASGYEINDDETAETFVKRCAEQDFDDGGRYVVYEVHLEMLQLDAWRRAIEAGTIGNKYAVSLDVYEHSGISYSVSGEGMQCRWDTARGGALWIPCDETIENIRIVAAARGDKSELSIAREFARAEAEEYTSWCNGDCYGVVVTTYDAQGTELDSDECWGYIGCEYAEQVLKETFAGHAK